MKEIRTIKGLFDYTDKTIYLYFRDDNVKMSFAKRAGIEGICFGNGVSVIDNVKELGFTRLLKDGDYVSVSFVGHIGHMRIYSGDNTKVVVDYKRYIEGEKQFFLKNPYGIVKNKEEPEWY